MAQQTSLRKALDKILDGGLREYVRVRRQDAKKTWQLIAMELFADHGVEVTSETLRTWFAAELDDDDEVRAS